MKQKLRSLVRKIFLRAEGGLCPAWRAALGILLTLAAYSAVLYGLASLFGALFDAWGLTTANLTRAPRWAQSVVRWHSDFCYALAYGAGIAVSALWARRFSVSAQTDKGASETAAAMSAESAPAFPLDGASAKPAGKDARSNARAAAFSAKNFPSDSHASSLRAETSRPADHAQEFRTATAETASSRPSFSLKSALFAALLGLLLSGGLGVLALATDCMRAESPWSAPYLSPSQLSALLVLALGRLLGEIQLVLHNAMGVGGVWIWSVAIPIAGIYLFLIWLSVLLCRMLKLNGFICIALILFLCFPAEIATTAIAAAYAHAPCAIRWVTAVGYVTASLAMLATGVWFELRSRHRNG